MRRGSFPIILTLIILVVAFGGWMTARYHGLFYHKTAEDVNVCINKDKGVLFFQWKDYSYNIAGYSSYCHDGDSVLHLSFRLTRGNTRNIAMNIDTSKMKFIEMYGKKYLIDEIPVCE